MQVENGGLSAMADLVKQPDFSTEPPSNSIPMIQTHRHRQCRFIQQRVREPALNMGGDISSLGSQKVAHKRVNRLRAGLNTSGAHEVAGLFAQVGLQRMFGDEAAEDVAGTNEENRGHAMGPAYRIQSPLSEYRLPFCPRREVKCRP